MKRKQFDDTLEAINFVIKNMATTQELQEIDTRLTALESKVLGILRRLDDEAMERVDVKALFARLSKLEDAVFDGSSDR